MKPEVLIFDKHCIVKNIFHRCKELIKNTFVKYFKGNEHIKLLVNDKKILQKHNEIWNKITSNLKKIDSEPVYNDKYVKTKISLNSISFYSNKMPKENEWYTLLSVILLDSIINVDKKYPQIFLEEFKYLVKNKTMMHTITKEFDSESDIEFDKYQNISDG